MATKKPLRPTKADITPKKAEGTEGKFECSMLGYTTLSQYTVQNLLFFLPLIQKGLRGALDVVTLTDFALAMKHLQLGLEGANLWPGYLMAALYYVLLDEDAESA